MVAAIRAARSVIRAVSSADPGRDYRRGRRRRCGWSAASNDPTPAASLRGGVIADAESDTFVPAEERDIGLVFRTSPCSPTLDPSRTTAVDVLVRPDDLRATPTAGGNAHGLITRRQYQGPSFVYRVETTGGDTIHCLHNHTESFEVGQTVSVDLVADHALSWYPAE